MRIDGLGLVDRNRPVAFSFDGKPRRGYAGDTVASALLAEGVRLFGRSFKYHRPRGVLTAGSEEPSALVTVSRPGPAENTKRAGAKAAGGAWTANTRATVQEIHDGLAVSSQNCWPSPSFDLLAVNDFLHPFLGAGFYYKTFMWPGSFWEKVYEPAIRRAAGLGRLPKVDDDTPREKAWAHCDLLVIGAGPAGLMAALTGARAGARVILADETPLPGGRLLSESLEVGGLPGADWAARTSSELRNLGVRIMTRTTVTGVYDGGVFGAHERVGEHLSDRPAHLPDDCFWRIVARRAVLCAGAHERLVAFPGNDRPGVMQASAVRTYLRRYGVSPGRRVVVFGNNDDAHRTARDLAAAGVEVAGFAESREGVDIPGDFPVWKGARVVATRGRLGLRSVTVRHASGTEEVPCDCLAVSGGWNPAVHLTCHMNGKPVWNESVHAFVPDPDAVPGMEAAGAALGQFSTRGALKSGAFRARRALEAMDFKVPSEAVPEAEDDGTRIAPLWFVQAGGRAWLDLQNDVTVKDVRQAAAENLQSVEHMKRWTTQGMATDQGKVSNVAALAVLADATGRPIPETGTTTFRPPYTPVPIGTLGAGGRGEGFAPLRLTTSHAWSLSRGAPMIEAGLWLRPSYFPAEGESHWRESCDREVGYVRNTVGVADVSTLGKIDVQGPDAGAFLDFVYTGMFSTLREGRVKYGLMLREDGHVMDDGTAARLGAARYLITTTTAAAGQVMTHLDFVAQCLKPGMRVRFASATEQWAQFAVAGPKAGDLIGDLIGEPPALDFMGWRPVSPGGVEGRLFRISFSGEEGYEIAVPARFGASLWAALAERAESLGGGPYGMEALNVLRIEKGFPTHAELHGRATAFDLGFGGMMSGGKDFVGRTMAAREGLVDPDRERLVGLKPVDDSGRITAGAHLFGEGERAARENDQGHVTSACHSPTLGCDIGLGFLERGPERRGERVRLVDHLRGVDTVCEVTSPVFFDADGGRMRG